MRGRPRFPTVHFTEFQHQRIEQRLGYLLAVDARFGGILLLKETVIYRQSIHLLRRSPHHRHGAGHTQYFDIDRRRKLQYQFQRHRYRVPFQILRSPAVLHQLIRRQQDDRAGNDGISLPVHTDFLAAPQTEPQNKAVENKRCLAVVKMLRSVVQGEADTCPDRNLLFLRRLARRHSVQISIRLHIRSIRPFTHFFSRKHNDIFPYVHHFCSRQADSGRTEQRSQNDRGRCRKAKSLPDGNAPAERYDKLSRLRSLPGPKTAKRTKRTETT